uniref:Uncharacterized protein n=1 Tax=Megaviridae environmental sample TaxID=1737588 RepID=A0A5J6VIN3_9VIRU|nr:MAG: hypothetical protein [Megaviridae environmental sample]
MNNYDIPPKIKNYIQSKLVELYYRDYPMQVDFNAEDYYNRRITKPMEFNIIKYDEGKHYYWAGVHVKTKRYQIEVNDIIVIVNIIGEQINIDIPYYNDYKIQMKDGEPTTIYKPNIELYNPKLTRSNHILLFIGIIGLLVCIV